MKILAIIPTYNEEGTIQEVIDRTLPFVPEGSILIVDDGSTDATRERVEMYRGIKKIYHQYNLGYGAALKDGFNFAVKNGYDVVITLDGDLQHPPELIPVFIKEIGRCDIASGSRYHPRSPRYSDPPEDRALINRRVTRLINRHLNLDITDAFCGLKAYRRKVLESLSIREFGYAMPIEVWVQVAHYGFKVNEVPVPLYYPDKNRFFGSGLDCPEDRFRYYTDVLRREMIRWNLGSLPLLLTPTMRR